MSGWGLKSLLSLEAAIRDGEATRLEVSQFIGHLKYRYRELYLHKEVYDKYMKLANEYLKGLEQ